MVIDFLLCLNYGLPLQCHRLEYEQIKEIIIMKKRISDALLWGGILLTVSLLGGCRELEEKIDSVSSRVDQIENTRIKTISEQINAIETSLPKLEQTDRELKGYI